MKHLLFLASLFLFMSLYAGEDHAVYASIKYSAGKSYSKDSRQPLNITKAEGHLSQSAFRRNQVIVAKYLSHSAGEMSAGRAVGHSNGALAVFDQRFSYFTPLSLKLIFPEHYFW